MSRVRQLLAGDASRADPRAGPQRDASPALTQWGLITGRAGGKRGDDESAASDVRESSLRCDRALRAGGRGGAGDLPLVRGRRRLVLAERDPSDLPRAPRARPDLLPAPGG